MVKKNSAKIEEKKTFYMSLLYLKSEAHMAGMEETEKQLNEALNKALDDIGENKTLIQEFRTTREFVERALNLDNVELHQLLHVMDWFCEDESEAKISNLN